jgi:WhiB family redox-sensing transcriptional regulator
MSVPVCPPATETSRPGSFIAAAAPCPVKPTLAELPCRNFDPDLWFADAPEDLERAKSLCSLCPIQARCLATALDREEPCGVWGGELFDCGVVVARKRPRGRPRKTPLCA